MVYLLRVFRVFANTQVIATINQLCRQSDISFEQNLYQSPNVKKGYLSVICPRCSLFVVTLQYSEKILISVQTSYLTIDMWETICINWFASHFCFKCVLAICGCICNANATLLFQVKSEYKRVCNDKEQY